MSDTLTVPQMTDFATRVAQPLITAVPGVASAEVGGGQTLAMRIWIDPVKLAARGLSASDLAAALRANNVQSAPGQIKGKNTAINITAATDLRGIDDFRNMVVRSEEHTSELQSLMRISYAVFCLKKKKKKKHTP